MPRKLCRTRIERAPGFIDFVDADGDVARIPAPGRGGAARPRKLVRTGIAREPGYLYFIDRDGDLCRASLSSITRVSSITRG